MQIRNQLNEIELTFRKVKQKLELIHIQKKMRLIRLKGNNHRVWLIGWEWYSVKIQKSALAKVMMLKPLSGAVQIKPIKMIAGK